MCRCCQNCWEDFYWNCFEEKFCYDESIANYNPEEDEDYIASQKNGSVLGHIQTNDNNNLTVPVIHHQPMRRGNSALMSNAKIHEEDYIRETQTNVPMLGPEIIAVFANSQIFQDHQPTKFNRISTKPYLTAIHTPQRELPTTPKESEQDRLIRRLEANLNDDATDSTKAQKESTPSQPQPQPPPPTTTATTLDTPSEKRITFTISTDSSPEGSQTLTPKKFDAIAEEEIEQNLNENKIPKNDESIDEVILRPRLIDRHPHLHFGNALIPPKRTLRSVKSVPHFSVRSAASETDIFSITGSGSQISMTPEVPSISYSNLPKNYEDTPTIEKYRVSQSLYSIQTANAASQSQLRASQFDYSMPRYFRHSTMMTQSTEMIGPSSSSSTSISSIPKGESTSVTRQPEKEKSKRLQMLRGNLPPLLIHTTMSFRKNRDEGKQVD